MSEKEEIEEIEEIGSSIEENGKSFWNSGEMMKYISHSGLDIANRAIYTSMLTMRATNNCIKHCFGGEKSVGMLEKICMRNCVLSHVNSYKLARITLASKHIYVPEAKSEGELVGMETPFFPIPPMFLVPLKEDEEDDEEEEEELEEEEEDQEGEEDDEEDYEDDEEVVFVLQEGDEEDEEEDLDEEEDEEGYEDDD